MTLTLADARQIVRDMTPEQRALYRAALDAEALETELRGLVSEIAAAPAPALPSPPTGDGYPPVMGRRQAAEYCRVGINHMSQLLRTGAIASSRDGRDYRVRRDACDEWLLAGEREQAARRADFLRPGRRP